MPDNILEDANDPDVKKPGMDEAERICLAQLYGTFIGIVLLIGTIIACSIYRRRKKAAMLRQLETDAAKLEGVQMVPRRDLMLPSYVLLPPDKAQVSNTVKEDKTIHRGETIKRAQSLGRSTTRRDS
jgi:hypothetical protein